MATEDRLLLCEFVLQSQLGLHVLEPIGRILIRSGSKTSPDLIRLVNATQQENSDAQKRDKAACATQVQNVLTVLMKHNLIKTTFNEFLNCLHYHFDHEECLLRLSVPRYLKLIINDGKQNPASMLKVKLLTSVYLAGSLTKKELVDQTLYGLLKQKQTAASENSLREVATASHLESIIDELTLDHFLVGVSAMQIQTNQRHQDSSKTKDKDAAKKRDIKKAEKEATKKEKLLEAHSNDSMPLRLNFLRFIAWERKLAVMAFALQKVSSSEEESVQKVYRALVQFDQQSTVFYLHFSRLLRDKHELKSSQQLKTQGICAADLRRNFLAGQEITEKQVQDALNTLQQDQADLVMKVGHDSKQQQGLYAINWLSSFTSLQSTLVEHLVQGSYASGPYFAHFGRVVRILRQKGYLDEMELSRMCLLPQKNTRSILNRLVADNIVQLQEMPIKAQGGNAGAGGGMLMYGLSMGALKQHLGANVTKAILNVLLKAGKLDKAANLTLEMNHLVL